MGSRRLGLVVGASSTGVWDVVSRAPADVEIVALFERGDPVWSDLRESLEGELTCVEVDADTDLTGVGLDGICTFADDRLVLTARLASAAGLRFHSERTATALTDKGLQRDLLSGSAVGVSHRVVRTPDDVRAALAELAVPCILKPLGGWASRGVVRLDPGQPLGHPQLPAVVEELVPHGLHPRHGHLAGYLSVESVVVDGDRRHLMFTGRLPVAAPFRESGGVVPADLSPEEEERVLAAVDMAFDLLGVQQGTLHTELVLRPERCVVVEINGRLGGFVDSLAHSATGESLLERSLAAALGIAPSPLPPVRQAAAVLLVHLADVPVVQLDPLPTMDLRALEGVTRVEARSHPGALIDPLDGSAAAIGHCYVTAPDVAALAGVLERVRETVATQVGVRPVTEGDR